MHSTPDPQDVEGARLLEDARRERNWKRWATAMAVPATTLPPRAVKISAG